MPELAAAQDFETERRVPAATSQRKSGKKSANRNQGNHNKGSVLKYELSRFISGQTSLLRLLGARFMRRPGSFIAYTGLTAIACVIVINATSLQSERHPSPFFAVAPAASLVAAVIPMPPTRPANLRGPVNEAELAKQMMLIKDLQGALARRGYYIGQIDGQQSSRLDIAIREFEKSASMPITGEASEKLLTLVSASKLAMKDQLLVLIKDSTASTMVDRSKTNIQLQKALNKIGYGPVREDGVYGATTKSAIEQFERDHKLAVRGEPNGRVLKELSAASGIAVE